MTSQTPVTYKATLLPEHALSLLEIVIPSLNVCQRTAFSRVHTSQNGHASLDKLAEASGSTLECLFLPNTTHPTLLIRYDSGALRGFEFKPTTIAGCPAYDVVMLDSEVSRARYDLHHYAQSTEVSA